MVRAHSTFTSKSQVSLYIRVKSHFGRFFSKISSAPYYKRKSSFLPLTLPERAKSSPEVILTRNLKLAVSNTRR